MSVAEALHSQVGYHLPQDSTSFPAEHTHRQTHHTPLSFSLFLLAAEGPRAGLAPVPRLPLFREGGQGPHSPLATTLEPLLPSGPSAKSILPLVSVWFAFPALSLTSFKPLFDPASVDFCPGQTDIY